MSPALQPVRRLLIANRGEIALRIARSAAVLGIETCAICPEDDAESLHVRHADRVETLPGKGGRAYLDIAEVVAAGQRAGCDAVHPGYGFLSENADFARAAEAAGMRFVGPTAESLALYGDKIAARQLAERCGVPVLPGTPGPVDAAGAEAFFDTLPAGAAMIVKAVAGGGGRGMRLVRERDQTTPAVEAAAREAGAAFGSPLVYVERFVEAARHLEVQVLGDGLGQILTLGERDCTLQRRHQKVVEIAPAPGLDAGQRQVLARHAETLAKAGQYRSLGTFEFLLDLGTDEVFFIEANPRVQVEHTVTETIYGLDLIAEQLRIVAGLGLSPAAQAATPRGSAIQARVNMERITPKGDIRPSGGLIERYDPPGGPGVRVDGFAFAGYRTSPYYDSLLAKVVVSGADFAQSRARMARALSEFRIDGFQTNIDWLRGLLACPELAEYSVTTRFIEAHATRLASAAAEASAASEGPAPSERQTP